MQVIYVFISQKKKEKERKKENEKKDHKFGFSLQQSFTLNKKLIKVGHKGMKNVSTKGLTNNDSFLIPILIPMNFEFSFYAALIRFNN